MSSYRNIQSPAAATPKCVQFMMSKIKIIIFKLAAFIFTLAAIVLSIDLTLHGYAGGYACGYGWGSRHAKITKDYLYSSLPELGDRDFQVSAFVCGSLFNSSMRAHIVISSEDGEEVLAEFKKTYFDLKKNSKKPPRANVKMHVKGIRDYQVHEFKLTGMNGADGRDINVIIPGNKNANLKIGVGEINPSTLVR